jgi:hypothetical protein
MALPRTVPTPPASVPHGSIQLFPPHHDPGVGGGAYWLGVTIPAPREPGAPAATTGTGEGGRAVLLGMAGLTVGVLLSLALAVVLGTAPRVTVSAVPAAVSAQVPPGTATH